MMTAYRLLLMMCVMQDDNVQDVSICCWCWFTYDAGLQHAGGCELLLMMYLMQDNNIQDVLSCCWCCMWCRITTYRMCWAAVDDDVCNAGWQHTLYRMCWAAVVCDAGWEYAGCVELLLMLLRFTRDDNIQGVLSCCWCCCTWSRMTTYRMCWSC